MLTLRDALNDASRRFAPVSESPGLDAHVLMCEVLGVERSYLLAHPEATLTGDQAARFEALVARHAGGEPVAYILGRRGFYDRDFLVTPDVLIPRPETELLLERALAFTRRQPTAAVADVGTGSGALAVTLAAQAPQTQVYAVDVSEKALDVARQNAALHGVADRVVFLRGDLLAPLIERQIRLDLVMANLPYIASDEVPHLAVSRHEPTLALDGGADGLALIRRLLAQLPQACRPGARALLEIGAGQSAAVQALAPDAEVYQDYAGLERMVELVVFEVGG